MLGVTPSVSQLAQGHTEHSVVPLLWAAAFSRCSYVGCFCCAGQVKDCGCAPLRPGLCLCSLFVLCRPNLQIKFCLIMRLYEYTLTNGVRNPKACERTLWKSEEVLRSEGECYSEDWRYQSLSVPLCDNFSCVHAFFLFSFTLLHSCHL